MWDLRNKIQDTRYKTQDTRTKKREARIERREIRINRQKPRRLFLVSSSLQHFENVQNWEWHQVTCKAVVILRHECLPRCFRGISRGPIYEYFNHFLIPMRCFPDSYRDQHDGCSDDDVIGRYEESPEVQFMFIFTICGSSWDPSFVRVAYCSDSCHWYVRRNLPWFESSSQLPFTRFSIEASPGHRDRHDGFLVFSIPLIQKYFHSFHTISSDYVIFFTFI